ncbi:flagellar hook-length control protein FliK [Mahella australiensis]|uniref:Flagellar hook-length control protein-like, C-terminal domain protein n=1 Tax=Mahella australiensis (strain DSM 15567 / CIP 107919 / 50-1 BON) TaxID=697281 RepID=F4A1M2_MAHA5|nr:flagellar hook-length control protein FliK [Mahella australiensis]AEE96056.1 Flagellar hook-length control protein-like, C-terminal domain protein [Mahella australiensis 50-1 BON]
MMISQVINDLALQAQNATNAASSPGSPDSGAVAFLDLLTALSSRQPGDDKKLKSDDDTINAVIAGLMLMSGATPANDWEMSDLDDNSLADMGFNGDDGLSLEMIKGSNADLQGAIRSMAAQQEDAIAGLTDKKQADKPDDSNLGRLLQALEQKGVDIADVRLKLAMLSNTARDPADLGSSVNEDLQGLAVLIQEDAIAGLTEMAKGSSLSVPLLEEGTSISPVANEKQADKSGENNSGRLLQVLEQKGVDIADVKLRLAMLSNTARDPARWVNNSANGDSPSLVVSNGVVSAKLSRNITEPLSMTAEDNMEIKHDMNVGDIESAERDQPDSRQLYNSTIDNVSDITLNKANNAGMPSNDITGINTQKMDVPLKDAAGTIIDELQRYLLANKQPAPSGKIIFQLQPKNMGHIAVEMQYADGRLSAHIIADTSAAYQLIDGNLNQLQQAVQRSGFDSTQLTLTLSQHNMQETWSNSGGWAERHQYSGSGYSEMSVFDEPMHYSTEKPWDVWDEYSSINQYI